MGSVNPSEMRETSPGDPARDTQENAPDILAQIHGASAKTRRHKFLLTILITALGIGASIMSCVGQSFGYRQAHALEGIEQQLQEIRASCIMKP